MFSSHGHYGFSTSGNILRVDAWGPWNLEAAMDFDREVRRIVSADLAPGPWAMLVQIHGHGLYTPESLSLLKKLHLWRVEHGMRHVAIIHSNMSLPSSSITEVQFNQVYEEEKGHVCEQRYFSSKAEALKWLEGLGYGQN